MHHQEMSLLIIFDAIMTAAANTGGLLCTTKK